MGGKEVFLLRLLVLLGKVDILYRGEKCVLHSIDEEVFYIVDESYIVGTPIKRGLSYIDVLECISVGDIYIVGK